MIYDFKTYIMKIDEGYITTYDMGKTIEGIERILSEDNLSFDIYKKSNNTFEVHLKKFNNIKYLKETITYFLDVVFNLYGWFPSKSKLINVYGSVNIVKFDINELLRSPDYLTDVVITFEAKFDNIIENIPEKLYHLSIQEYEEDVLSRGLFPKSKSKLTTHDYDGRIYLCETSSGCRYLINKMIKFYSRERDNIIYAKNNPKKIYNKNTKWIIYEVDSKIGEIRKLYRDPNYIDGFYYIDYIKPDALSIYSKQP